MIGVTPDTRGRGAGEGRQNLTGAVDAAAALYRWSYLPGEPDAVKAARPGSGRGGWKRIVFMKPPEGFLARLKRKRHLAGRLLR
jgi:hypothetical protein